MIKPKQLMYSEEYIQVGQPMERNESGIRAPGTSGLNYENSFLFQDIQQSLVSSATDSASSLINSKLRCSRTTIALVPHAFLDLCQLLHQR